MVRMKEEKMKEKEKKKKKEEKKMVVKEEMVEAQYCQFRKSFLPFYSSNTAEERRIRTT
jgi:hypothetical protein